MGKLDGKVACITGGTRSIGRGIAEAFLADGRHASSSTVATRRRGRRCLDEIGAGDRAAFFAGDAANQATVEGLIDYTIERYGQLDICVLNSGGVRETAPVAPDVATRSGASRSTGTSTTCSGACAGRCSTWSRGSPGGSS